MSALRDGVSVVIPAHTPRVGPMLHRAVDSVIQQRYTPDAVIVEVDRDHRGAAETRNRGLAKVGTKWTAFLDSDDTMTPDHLAELMAFAEENPWADLVYPWFTVDHGFDPFPQYEGKPFDQSSRATIMQTANFIPVTVLVKTREIRDAGGFQELNRSTAPGASTCDEWGAWRAMLERHCQFAHLPMRTWTWFWHDGNTSGRGDRW